MQKLNQQNPCQTVIGYNGNQIVDRRNQRTGRNCRVYLDFMEQDRHERTDQTGNHDRYKQ